MVTLESLDVNIRSPEHNFTLLELNQIFWTLWTKDNLIFIPKRYQVQHTFVFYVYCITAEQGRDCPPSSPIVSDAGI